MHSIMAYTYIIIMLLYIKVSFMNVIMEQYSVYIVIMSLDEYPPEDIYVYKTITLYSQ